MSFTLAIVGRPNVGKSTLFNRLVGKRLALVDDRPGVTRDRREGAARLGDLRFTVVDTAGFDEAAPDSLIAPHDGADRAGDRRRRRGPVPDRRAQRPDADRPRLRRHRAARRQAGDRRRQQERGPRRRAAPPRPTRSASAIRSRSRPSTARASPTSTTRSAPRLPEHTAQPAEDDEESTPSRRPPDPRRGGRPAERRQVDADQPAARRGAPAHRPGSRHHPRRHRGRRSNGRAANSACTTPPACGARRASRRSWKSSRSPTRSTRSASPKW